MTLVVSIFLAVGAQAQDAPKPNSKCIVVIAEIGIIRRNRK